MIHGQQDLISSYGIGEKQLLLGMIVIREK